MSAAVLLLGLVTLQRVGELMLSRRNTRAALERGAYEVAAEHYPLIVALHATWMAGLWLLALPRDLSLPWLAGFLVLQAIRVWVIQTLGDRWTTRIIILPGEPLVRTGPYRFLPHPNYAVVIAEIAVLPMVFGLTAFALVFSVANALVLLVRVAEESAALANEARTDGCPERAIMGSPMENDSQSCGLTNRNAERTSSSGT